MEEIETIIDAEDRPHQHEGGQRYWCCLNDPDICWRCELVPVPLSEPTGLCAACRL